MNRHEMGDFLASVKQWQAFQDSPEIKYSNAVVAIVDILAFRHLLGELKDSAPKEIVGFFADAMMFAESSYSNLRFKILSDTLIVYGPDSHSITALNVMNVVQMFSLHLLKKGYLTRGAIVQGQHFIKDDIMVSPAFVKAYDYEQNLCIYPRIIVADDIATQVFSQCVPNQEGLFGIADPEENVFRIVTKENFIRDFDNHYVISCITLIGSLYLLTHGKSNVDGRNISQFPLTDIVDENLRSMSAVKEGLLLAAKRALKPKEKAKVSYAINQYNAIVNAMLFNTRKGELLLSSDCA